MCLLSRDIIGMLQQQLIGLVPRWPMPEPLQSAHLRAFIHWFQQQRRFVARRAALLKDWQQELGSRTEQLYPELVRYAERDMPEGW